MYRRIVGFLFLVFTGFAFAQSDVNSPYSSVGIGDVGFYGTAFTNALGGVSSVLFDSTQTNLYNPASYSGVSQQFPLFSLGVNHTEKWFSNATAKENARTTGLSHFAIVVPFAKRFGLAAGIKPLSRTGYDINDYQLLEGDTIHYKYKGRGVIQHFTLGFSGTVLQLPRHSLSLGINGAFLFGKIEDNRRAYRNTNVGETGGEDQKSLSAKGFTLDAGINYTYRINPHHKLMLGAIYRPGLDVAFENIQTRVFFDNYTSVGTYDTILSLNAVKGKVYIPSKISIGLAYSFAPERDSVRKRTKLPSVKVMAEYTIEDWSKYQERFSENKVMDVYANSTAYRFGIEFTPHRFPTDHSTSINFGDKISYRLGSYFINTPYLVNGTQLNNWGITAGVGFPFPLAGGVSSVNLALNYGEINGYKSAHSINERYLGINFGINIAPGYDRWFRKYKVD